MDLREQLLADIVPPFHYAADELPGLDFNREIVEPGDNETFPDGVLGIRVDDDFWAVAALPLKYRDKPLREIISALWPQYVEQATFLPDSGSIEQKLHDSDVRAKLAERRADHYRTAAQSLENEVARLRKGRPDLRAPDESRFMAERNYFARQYEHLLTAMAHTFEPREELPGVCERCGLFSSDRVHSSHFLALKANGYEPAVKHLVEFGERERMDASIAREEVK